MSVRLNEIVMEFPGSRALDRVSVDFRSGEVHGLIGENGAGKSTLMSILAGTRHPTDGTVEIEGKPVRFDSPRAALGLGIALVSQEGSLVPSLTGAQNILLGDEPRIAGTIIRQGAVLKRARTLLADWFPGIDIDLSVPVETLDVAERKVIEIVRALRSDVKFLILDEPTATLQSREKKILWEIIRSLPGRGIGVILISHFLSEVLALSDRITVLRDGALVGTHPASEMTETRMVDLMLRRTGDSAGKAANRQSAARTGNPVLTVKDWKVGTVNVAHFDLHPGEIVGLIGLTGAGHFGFARSLYQRLGVTSGEIAIGGEAVARPSPRAMERRGVAFVPDHRMENALVADGTITENLSMVHPETCATAGVLFGGRETREARRIIDLLNVRTTGPGQTIKTLSGGNKQKVSLGKWLYGAEDRYRVMIFIEPTEGVDVGAKQEIYHHIRALADKGAAILIASSDLLEIEDVTERVVPFVAGRAGADILAADFSEATFIKAMAGDAA
ncbi:sugar ABC transporter ATP-binding protein [Acuticoccus sp. MNP-M23]|uniref:sugar ABC transporter ATP-binding protein n=1 Tax=Acuticoccus sp. MNP-M23 TaxID=3072793 RepID=UPI0028162166|nr:sugar ABC transporter ATP-binding protein [Acuticoccus sp. MNP-M23]WMS43968.1 sugar ABC transporter ATP-binding protein [Acuticoccus sp. MNP-M23]